MRRWGKNLCIVIIEIKLCLFFILSSHCISNFVSGFFIQNNTTRILQVIKILVKMIFNSCIIFQYMGIPQFIQPFPYQ